MERTLEEEVRRIVASMDNEQSSQEQEQPGTTEQEAEPAETIHVHYFPDAIVILKEEESKDNTVVETTLAQTKQPPVFIAYAICLFYLFLILSTLAFQFYIILNPPSATVTIIPKAQTVTLNGTLQLGRVLQPLTISQSQTVPTTGKGHQDAKQAQGAITFYNGQLTSVTIPAGTILTASNGVQVITEQDALIPAESQTIPPTLGQTTVSAHALVPGTRGNIPTGDINQGCCAPSVLAQNTASFHNGQDERNFQTVTKMDIDTSSISLKTTLAQSVSGALQGQVQPPEQLYILPCTSTILSDHQPGQEATQVKVTVSETCSAVAYISQVLEAKATAFLSTQALQQIRTGYSLFGTVQVSVTQATVTNSSKVFVSFHAQGTWVYALSQTAQQQIKNLIAGKSKQKALTLLASLPGMKQASIRFDGFGDDTRLPKNPANIHLLLIFSA